MSLQKETRLKYLVAINTDHAESNDGYIGLENVESWSGQKIETDTPEAEGVAFSYKKGDVLFGKLRPYLAKCYVAEEDACCSTEFLVMRPKKIVSKYLKYRILSTEFIDQVNMSTYGAKMPRANWSFIGNMKLIVPSIEKQQIIANYLDDRCSKIDAIIAEAKASIEEYKELKQAVIYEAVTKGLDKNAKMKDSGVEWVGKIPNHWIMTKLKYLLESPLQYGANAIGIEYDEKLPRYVRITDISIDGTLKNDNKQSLPLDVSQEYILDIGDVLFARSGGTVGKAFLYNKKDGLCAFAGYLIRAKCKNGVIAKFLYYYTMSSSYNIWKNGIFSQATIQNISAEKYANMPLPLPTELDEIRSIILFIDENASKMDAMISEKQSLIEDLEAYKKSLIYEVVTGKRKVVE